MKHTLKILSKVPIRKTQYNGQKKKDKKTTMVEKCYTENF